MTAPTTTQRWWKPRSLRTRLILWNSVTLALLLGILGAVLQYVAQKSLLTSVDSELKRRTERPPGGRPPRDRGFSGRPFDNPEGKPPDAQPPDGPDHKPDQEGGPGPKEEPDPGPPGEPSGDGKGRKNDGRPPQDDRPPPGDPKQDGRDGDPYRPRLMDLQGHMVVPRNSTVKAPWDEVAYEAALKGEPVRSTLVVDGVPLRIYTRPIPSDGPMRGVIQVAYPLTDIYRATGSINQALLLLLPVALGGAALGGVLLTNRALRPVQLTAQAAEKIGAQDLSRRLEVIGEDEFANLAVTFNRMLGRLETAFTEQRRLLEQQQRFTADASHELQTPLAIIKANTSLTLSGEPDREECVLALREIDDAAGTMSRLVKDLLLLARSDGGRLGQDSIVLSCREIVERAIGRVAHRQMVPIRVVASAAEPSVSGNEEELIRVFCNLLENALRYTPVEGEITVTITQSGGRVVIAVADTGTGIAPEHLPHLGERFFRAESSRSRQGGGTGLGLSICRSIVLAHEGIMEFESQVGVGTTVRITLPVVQWV